MPVPRKYPRRRRRIGRYLLVLIVALGAYSFSRQGLSAPGAAHVGQEQARLSRRLVSLERGIEREQRAIERLRRVRRGQIGPGPGFFQALEDIGVSLPMSLSIVNALTDSVEILHLTAGEPFWVMFDSLDAGRVLLFSYSPHPAVSHRLQDDGSGTLHYSRVDYPTTVRHRLYEGTLGLGSTLDQMLREQGIHSSLVGVVNGVLQCRISFRTHARQGDRFRILVQERFFQDSVRIDGQVLYTYYEGTQAGTHETFRYEDFDPKSSYTAHYTEEGQALIFSSFRYPLDRLHISSPYGMRRHPLTGRRAMHWGVDYRAPTGTPIHAVADGVVVQSSFDNTNGHYVVLRHRDNYQTYYLHLHQRLVRPGQHVRTRQTIGRVGNTGISTGPHLHFGVKRPGGSWMDPLKKRMIATPKLDGPRLASLQEQITAIRAQLDLLGAAPQLVMHESR